jgi:hypothetical protein
MSLEFGLAVINLLINMEVNVLTIGFNPKINKAVATLISGYRLFFWLKIRCFKGIKEMYEMSYKIIFTSHIYFKGLRDGKKVTLLYPKKNIFDWYLAVDNSVDKL